MSWTHPDRPSRTIEASTGKVIEVRLATYAKDIGRVAGPLIADALGPHATPWDTPPDSSPHPVLGFGTSSVLTATFDEFIGYYLEGWLSMERANAFCLNEYVGIAFDEQGSLRHALNWGLFFPTDLPAERVIGPDGMANDPEAEAAAIEQQLAESGGIDLLVLPVEADGRVGFNEAGAPHDSPCRVTTLSDTLRTSLTASFGGVSNSVPARGTTLGLGSLKGGAVRSLLLVATGPEAGEVLARALTGTPDASLPLGFVQSFPGSCIVVADADASRGLP